MATAVGGDIEEFIVNHPTLGARSFKPKANEDNTFDRGGIRSDDDEAMITTDGELIVKLTRVRGFIEVVLANDQGTANDSDFLNQLSASPESFDLTISLINGSTFGAKGRIVGSIEENLNAATVSIKVAFSQAKKIA